MKLVIVAASAFALSASGAVAQGSAISLARAIGIAEQMTGAKATDGEVDRWQSGRPIYEIELVKDRSLMEVEVDGHTGRVVRQDRPRLKSYYARWFEDDELREMARARSLAPALTELERETGGRVTEVSFDVERGRARFEVEISTPAGVTEVHLDPANGQRLAIVAEHWD